MNKLFDKRLKNKKKNFRILTLFLVATITLLLIINNSIKAANFLLEEEIKNGNDTIKVLDTVDSADKLKKVGGEKIPTDDTFKSIGGDYTLKYILRHYNIFSFNDIQGTHVVGPIIAQNKAYRTSGSSAFIVSDYSNGIPSYVGILERIEDQNKATFNINYGFEFNRVQNFKPPNLYTSLSNNQIKSHNSTYTVIDSKGEFTGPNNTGQSPILQNDNFINFEEARAQILQESQNLANRVDTIEVSPEPDTGYLKIEAGRSYIIKDASRLRIIDIQYPKGYDVLQNRYPYPTFVNIVDDSLCMSGESFEGLPGISQEKTFEKIDGADHQYFPAILVNGERFNGGQAAGKDFEYGEDNNIVWNLPNIKTKDGGHRVAMEDGYDILGHIIAPNAEFWNYRANGEKGFSWNGGNMNGCAIVDSWHGGNRESHMWPFALNDIDKPIKKDLLLVGKKELIGAELKDYDFKFSLDLFEGTLPSGIYDENIPQVVSANSSGKIHFLPITFKEEGNYTFRIKEEIPNPQEKGITYDKSEYRVDVSVVKNTKLNALEVNHKITKIKDFYGNTIDSEEVVNEVVFNNKKVDDHYELPSTGGVGDDFFLILGAITMIMSVWFLIKRR